MSYYGYDALDRLAWVRADALGTDATAYYSYDAVGNRTGLTDAELHTTSFAYDALRRLLHEQDALGKTEYYVYDAVGNLAHLTNGDGQTTYFSYDALDRRTQIAFPEGFSAYFDYDEVGNLTQGSDSNETDDFAYDALNRVASRAIGGVGTVYFAYDLAGRRTRLEDPKGAVVYYTYDKRGLTTRVDAPFGSTYYSYDARGAMLSKHLPNGTVAYHSYDDAGRLSKLENRKSEGSAISTFEFTRDANGNITKSLREDGSCWYYAYDGLQRLTAADWKDAGGVSLYAFEYDYDKVGDRLRFAQNGVSTYYSYNAANELLHEVTPGVETAYYTYDGRGNQTQRQVLAGHTLYFEYNSRNLIAAISSDDPAFTTNTFQYNGLGQRIEKVDSTGTTRYIWDGLNIILELDASGNVHRRYTHGYSPIEGVADLLAVQDDLGCPCFYHFDQVGGVRELTDRWQNVIKGYEYEAFGRILAEGGSAPNDFLFPAPYLKLPADPDLRLSPTRLYDPRPGRFTTRDPMRGMDIDLDQVGGVRQLNDRRQNPITSYAYGLVGGIPQETGNPPNDSTFPATHIKLPNIESLTLSPTKLFGARRGRYFSRGQACSVGCYPGLGNNPTRLTDAEGKRNGDAAAWRPPDAPIYMQIDIDFLRITVDIHVQWGEIDVRRHLGPWDVARLLAETVIQNQVNQIEAWAQGKAEEWYPKSFAQDPQGWHGAHCAFFCDVARRLGPEAAAQLGRMWEPIEGFAARWGPRFGERWADTQTDIIANDTGAFVCSQRARTREDCDCCCEQLTGLFRQARQSLEAFEKQPDNLRRIAVERATRFVRGGTGILLR